MTDEMMHTQLLLESLEKEIEQQNKKIKNKKELNEITQKLIMQVMILEKQNIIQRTLADEFLQKIKNKYIEAMIKFSKLQIIDMEDGFYTEKENIIISEKRAKNEHMKKTMNEWEQELEQQTINKGLDKFDKEALIIDKEKERTHNIEESKI